MKNLVGLLMLLAAVQINADPSVDARKSSMDGAWEWASTYGGYAGELYTPESEHYSLTLVFLKDEPRPQSDSIGYRVYRNDTLILSGFITLSSSAVQMQPFGPGNLIFGVVEKVTDTLLLGVGFSDGYSSIFVRSATSLRMNQSSARTAVQRLPSNLPSNRFTLSGRRIDNRLHGTLPLQMTVSRRYSALRGIGGK